MSGVAKAGQPIDHFHRFSKSEPLGSPGPLPAVVRKAVEQAASTSMPVTLEGETGTGKTYIAEWIHRMSARTAGPFVPVNCGVILESCGLELKG